MVSAEAFHKYLHALAVLLKKLCKAFFPWLPNSFIHSFIVLKLANFHLGHTAFQSIKKVPLKK